MAKRHHAKLVRRVAGIELLEQTREITVVLALLQVLHTLRAKAILSLPLALKVFPPLPIALTCGRTLLRPSHRVAGATLV